MKTNKWINGIFVFLFWVTVWQLLYMHVNQGIILPSPLSVLLRLLEFIKTKEFWQIVGTSTIRVFLAILYGIIIGTVLALLSYKSFIVKSIVWPAIGVIKAMPVVTFIILLMFFLKTDVIAVVIGAIMVIPIVYVNLLEGLKNIDIELLEMLNFFKVPYFEKVKKFYLPSMTPYFIATINTAVSLGWKATISAEVLSLPKNSIGYEIYSNKIYFDIDQLFAWAIVVILCSVFFETVVRKITKRYLSGAYENKKFIS